MIFDIVIAVGVVVALGLAATALMACFRVIDRQATLEATVEELIQRKMDKPAGRVPLERM